MKILSDRILVKPLPKEENKTVSGIILGNKPKNEHDFEVVLLGTEVKHCKIGDVVRKFKNVAGTPIEYNGIDCFLLKESSEIEFVNPD
jgi:co-chaperonin GroES (HSP10)